MHLTAETFSYPFIQLWTMGYYNQVIKVACDVQYHVFPTRTPEHTRRPFLYCDTSPKSPEAFLRNLVTWSGECHFSRLRQDLKRVLWTFSRLRTFKGTHSTISSRSQWILSARVACQMSQWNCGRHTDN